MQSRGNINAGHMRRGAPGPQRGGALRYSGGSAPRCSTAPYGLKMSPGLYSSADERRAQVKSCGEWIQLGGKAAGPRLANIVRTPPNRGGSTLAYAFDTLGYAKRLRHAGIAQAKLRFTPRQHASSPWPSSSPRTTSTAPWKPAGRDRELVPSPHREAWRAPSGRDRRSCSHPEALVDPPPRWSFVVVRLKRD
jgi:hypothetical protein